MQQPIESARAAIRNGPGHKEAAEQAKRFRICEADPIAILYEVERISGSTRLNFEVWSLHENF